MDVNLKMAEVPIGMVQPHVILPSQYFESRARLTPEHRLRMAVLDDAIQCVHKYRFATNAQGQRRFHEVMRWLLSDETDWPYSFEGICEVLDLDANAVRRRLRLARKRQPVAVWRQMRKTAHERGTGLGEIGHLWGFGSRYPIVRSATRGEPHVATQTE